MTGVGPFSIAVVVALLAALAGYATARLSARRQPDAPTRAAGALLVDAVFIGLLVARAAYVVRWWPQYAAAPWSIAAIGDGGFAWWAGLPAALAFVAWRTRRLQPLRRPALLGVAAGVAVWLAGTGVVELMHRSAPPLPATQLTTLDGTPARLDGFTGAPVVVNLWATWCPPCRREMPALAEAQAAYPGVRFVLPNQGEAAQTVRDFLAEEGLALDHVLLDPHAATMRAYGSRGLPTTLFFAADGRLVDTHMGELTRASLADTLRRRFGAVATLSSPPPESHE